MTSNARLLMLTEPIAGHDAEFRRWYRDVHGPQLLRVPGITGLTMYRYAQSQLLSGTVLDRHRYLACYDLDGDPADVAAGIASHGSQGLIDPGSVIDRTQSAPLSLVVERLWDLRA